MGAIYVLIFTVLFSVVFSSLVYMTDAGAKHFLGSLMPRLVLMQLAGYLIRGLRLSAWDRSLSLTYSFSFADYVCPFQGSLLVMP